ncbi:MAG TPA: glycosyltransferase [Xanthobacteraceae bacterium]
MGLTVLSVAYPLAPVSPDCVGGAEQVLSQIDDALVRAGHCSLVVACDGSRVAGRLLAVSRETGSLEGPAIAAAHARHRRVIAAALGRWQVDVVHMHGVDFPHYLPRTAAPVLVTLHLPLSFYPPEVLRPGRGIWVNCVSQSQHAGCRPHAQLLPPIENGVADHFFVSGHAKRNFALVLARICPEKGVHLAIAAAQRAGVPLLIAGEVFSYPEHQEYFEAEIRPRLDRWRRFIGPIGLARKRRLLAAAHCLLVPSLVPETSSLAAREALASGTAVIGFSRGALAEVVEHGRTGFLVNNEREMADAITRAPTIIPSECRRFARRFSLQTMTSKYIETYRALCRPANSSASRGAA